MKRENIYKANELDSRIRKIDETLNNLSMPNLVHVKVFKSELPELFERTRKELISGLADLKAAYEKQIEELV